MLRLNSNRSSSYVVLGIDRAVSAQEAIGPDHDQAVNIARVAAVLVHR